MTRAIWRFSEFAGDPIITGRVQDHLKLAILAPLGEFVGKDPQIE